MEFTPELLFVFVIGVLGGTIILRGLITGRIMGLYGMFPPIWPFSRRLAMEGKWVSKKFEPLHYWLAIVFYAIVLLLMMSIFIMSAFDVTLLDLRGTSV